MHYITYDVKYAIYSIVCIIYTERLAILNLARTSLSNQIIGIDLLVCVLFYKNYTNIF